MENSDKPDTYRYQERRSRLRSRLERQGLPFFVVTDLHNIFYLTGFRGSAGVAVLGEGETWLWVDPRYTLQAKDTVQRIEVIEDRGSLLKAVARFLRKKNPRIVGCEANALTYNQLRLLQKLSGGKVRFEPTADVVEALRVVKDETEIALIREACRVTVEVFKETVPQAKPGVRECDLAAEIEFRMRRRGAEGAAFETIVASGARSAYPHARASQKPLAAGELVIFDLGAILAGYAADMTRTIFLGQPSRRLIALYRGVLTAQRKAVDALRPGARCCDVDAAARRVLQRRHLADFFTHSTGHGVGLDIHEKPRLAKTVKTRLKSGSVVTAEPGVYLEGVGGIRLEDTVLVGPGGPEVLTPAPMDAWVV